MNSFLKILTISFCIYSSNKLLGQNIDDLNKKELRSEFIILTKEKDSIINILNRKNLEIEELKSKYKKDITKINNDLKDTLNLYNF